MNEFVEEFTFPPAEDRKMNLMKKLENNLL